MVQISRGKWQMPPAQARTIAHTHTDSKGKAGTRSDGHMELSLSPPRSLCLSGTPEALGSAAPYAGAGEMSEYH